MTATTTAAVYELRNVSRTYSLGGANVNAVRDVDLALEGGESVAVVGPSGSGKTTLLQLLGALDRPSSGEVVFEGRDLGRLGDGELAALRLERARLRVPAVQPDPDADRGAERRGWRSRRPAIARAQRESVRGELLGAVGLAERGRAPAQPALGWRAAARRDRARARERPARAAGRRADRQSRLDDGRGDHRPASVAFGPRPAAHGHRRDARRRGRRTGAARDPHARRPLRYEGRRSPRDRRRGHSIFLASSHRPLSHE